MAHFFKKECFEGGDEVLVWKVMVVTIPVRVDGVNGAGVEGDRW